MTPVDHSTNDAAFDGKHLCLFNDPGFAALNTLRGMRYHRIDYLEGDRLVGTLAGVISDEAFVSGYSAGFGGVDFLRETERPDVVFRLVESALEELRGLGVRTVRIRAKPFHYSGSDPYLHLALLRHGFTVEEANLNFYFDLARYHNADGYLKTLRHSPKRLVLRAMALESDWREVESARDWAEPYDVLSESRTRHGASLSLSLAYVKKLQQTFPGRVRMYALSREGTAIAACLLYSVTREHGMVMYWGDRQSREAAGKEQPFYAMNLVAYRTVESAITLGLKTVDLGPVSTAESVNFGNCIFKASINAVPDFRYTLTKSI